MFFELFKVSFTNITKFARTKVPTNKHGARKSSLDDKESSMSDIKDDRQ